MNRWLTICLLMVVSMTVRMFPCLAGQHTFTVVIDPGHGGHDWGAKGVFTVEKDINLSVARMVAEDLRKFHRDIHVLLTRNDDRFVRLEDRAAIARHAMADLLVSIHTNSMEATTPFRNKAQGTVAYVVGCENMAQNLQVMQRESTVMELDDSYSIRRKSLEPARAESSIMFELNRSRHRRQSIRFAQLLLHEMRTVAHRQNGGVHQAGFFVLTQATMPAVLIELDYISNPQSEAYMASQAGCKQMAQALSNAIINYRRTVH